MFYPGKDHSAYYVNQIVLTQDKALKSDLIQANLNCQFLELSQLESNVPVIFVLLQIGHDFIHEILHGSVEGDIVQGVALVDHVLTLWTRVGILDKI